MKCVSFLLKPGNTQPPTTGNQGSLSGYCVVPPGGQVGTCQCLPGIGGLNCQVCVCMTR